MKQLYKILFIACFSIVLTSSIYGGVEGKVAGVNSNSVVNIEETKRTADGQLQIMHATCDELGSAYIIIDPDCAASTTVNWSTGATGFAVTDLDVGNYEVSVTYNDPQCGQSYSQEFTILQSQDFIVSIEKSGSLCAGPVTLTAIPYGVEDLGIITYEWSINPAEFTQDIVITNEGTYRVVATAGNCVDTAEIVLSNADFFEIVYTSYMCPGKPGSIAVEIVDPAVMGSEFFYSWSTGAISSGIIVSEVGTYTVTVTSSEYNCSAEKSMDVEFTPEMDIAAIAKDVSCFGLSDGRATVFGSGGIGNITYVWSTRTVGREIINMSAGEYFVTATDGAGCTTSKTVRIAQPDLLEFELTPEDSRNICEGDRAILTATVSGGKHPYTYSWKDDENIKVQVRDVAPTETTTYEIVVTDFNGCTTTPQKTTIQVSPKINSSLSKTDLLCHGACTGAATIELKGGVEPFSYSWDSPTNSINDLCGGQYSVVITDLYNCSDTIRFAIEEPDTLAATIYTKDVNCFGGNDGYIRVDVTGGVKNYTYSWSSTNNASSAIEVSAGYHTVTITDAKGCEIIETIRINQPEKIYITNPLSGRICIGETFFIEINATGGKGPYTFEWSGSDDSNWYGSAINVSPKVTTVYTLKVTDANGCVGDAKSVTVTVNPEISISGIKTEDMEVCLGDKATLDMDIQGGNGGPYKIILNNSNVVNIPYSFIPEKSGYVKLTVFDGCSTPSVSDSLYMRVKSLPEASFVADKTSACPFSEIKFSEINPVVGQTYHWEFGDGAASNHRNPSYIYREPGVYDVSVTVTSSEGCKKTYTAERIINIYQNPIANFDVSPDFVSILDSEIKFNNITQYGSNYYWDFGDGNTSLWTEKTEISHTYRDAGNYEVALVATNDRQCLDTIRKNVLIHEMYTFYAPDAFTPNNDGVNDYFYISGTGIQEENFSLIVYDRFGSILFETNIYDNENPYNMAWDGTAKGNLQQGDNPVSNGVYIWRCLFVDLSGKPHEKNGQITLIR
jgi:gliding motility-associated-like protein